MPVETRRRKAAAMKRGTRDDVAPAAPPPPRSMGALTCLPEVLVGHVCAFLPCRDIKRLRTTCSALRREPRCTPARITLARWPYEEDRDRRLAALTRLARHAAPVVKELRFEKARLVEPLLAAVLAGAESLPSLTCLHLSLFGDTVDCNGDYPSTGITERAQVLLGEALAAGRLPALRELQLNYGFGTVVGRLEPVWKALGQGACPLLERLKVDDTDANELGEDAVLALRSRRDRGLPDLTALSLLVFSESEDMGSDEDVDEDVEECEDVEATLLNCLSPATILELELQLECESYSWSPLLAAFLQRGCPVLLTLKLTTYDMPGDALLHALADGAAPSLTDLALSGINCSKAAWRAVAEAMGTDGLCLRRLKKLELVGAFNRSSKALECFMQGVGEGHGCPDLHTLSLDRLGAPCGAVVAQAFREPRGLPCLRHLKLGDLELSDLEQLILSLQHRPHALQPIETLDLNSHQNVSASWLVSLGKAMQEGRSLAGLKELLLHNSMDEKKDWESKLAEALASGAGRQLEVIDWWFPSHEYRSAYCRVQGMNCFLRALAWRGACPVLKYLRVTSSCGTAAAVRGLDMVALGVLLTGSAACSATLRSVGLKPFELRKEDVALLAIFLHHTRVVELEALHLVVAADGAGFLSDALSALKGRAGRRMEELSVTLLDSKVDKGKQVASLLVDVISSGGLPNLRSSDRASVSVDVHKHRVLRDPWDGWFDVGGKDLRQAVRNRAL